MTLREQVHQLIDAMTDEQVIAAERYLSAMTQEEDLMLKTLMNAPVDTEPLTEEEIESIRASEEDSRHGRVLSLEEAERKLLNR